MATPSFVRVALPADTADMVRLLTENDWPFHASRYVSPDDVDRIALISDAVDSYWIVRDGAKVGVVRLLDLDDLTDGSPLFDIRIAACHRGAGLGTAAVRWLTTHLFTEFQELHRVEATTREDNGAMRRVFERCGYRLEGQLRDAWRSCDGTRHDTMIYGITRPEWAET